LAANEKIAFQLQKQFFTKLKTSHEQILGVLQITWKFLGLRGQNSAQKIRQNRDILNRVRLSWARRAQSCIVNDGKHFFDVEFFAFTHNYSLFLCCLRLCCFLSKLQALFYHHFSNFIKNSL
jgi:hypothetical protein